MRKISWGKHFTVLLAALLVMNNLGAAQATQTQDMFRTSKLKASVQKRGVGEKAKVRVRLRSKEEINGYISKIDDASFEVTDKTTGHATTILYADAERVQSAGMSKGAKIGIIAGVGVTIAAIVFAAELKAHGY